MQQSTKKKHGGHLTGFRHDLSKGGGPVLAVRGALGIEGIGQDDMAKRLGCSVSAVRKWEKAKGGPKPDGALWRELERLAVEAGVDLSEWE